MTIKNTKKTNTFFLFEFSNSNMSIFHKLSPSSDDINYIPHIWEAVKKILLKFPVEVCLINSGTDLTDPIFIYNKNIKMEKYYYNDLFNYNLYHK
jgi:hypothetical protein